MDEVAYSADALADVNVSTVIVKLAGSLNSPMHISNVYSHIHYAFLIDGEA